MDRFILPHGRTTVNTILAAYTGTLSVFFNGAADTELDEFACGYLMGIEIVSPEAGGPADVSFALNNVLNSGGDIGEDLLGGLITGGNEADLSGGAGDVESYMLATPLFLDGKCHIVFSRTGVKPLDIIFHIDSRWS